MAHFKIIFVSIIDLIKDIFIRFLDFIITKMIKYVYIPDQQEVPEWKECYYDRETLEDMLEFL